MNRWLTGLGVLGALLRLPPASAATLPRPDHVVVVIEENTDLGELLAEKNTPFLFGRHPFGHPPVCNGKPILAARRRPARPPQNG